MGAVAALPLAAKLMMAGAAAGGLSAASKGENVMKGVTLGTMAGAAGGVLGGGIGAGGAAGAGGLTAGQAALQTGAPALMGQLGMTSTLGGVGSGLATGIGTALQTGAPAALGKLGATKAMGGLSSNLATSGGAAGPAFSAGGGTVGATPAWATKSLGDLAGAPGVTGGGAAVGPGAALTSGQVATQTGAPATLGLAKGAIGNTGGGMLSTLSGLIPKTTSGKMQAAYGLGSVADYITKGQQIGKQQEASQQALSQYLSQFKQSTEWSDADREAMMKGIYGIYADEEAAMKRKGAASAAARGTGGGAYGKTAQLARQRGLEQAARALAATHGPSGVAPSFSPYQLNAAASSRDAASETMGDLLGLGGQLSSLYFAKQLFN